MLFSEFRTRNFLRVVETWGVNHTGVIQRNRVKNVRLARKYPIRYTFCTTALEELERTPRSLPLYIIPGAMPFTGLDIFGVAAVRHATLKDRVRHYARNRYLSKWLLIDSTYEHRDICTPEYVSLACDLVEGLRNTKLLKRITQWLDCTQEPVTFLGEPGERVGQIFAVLSGFPVHIPRPVAAGISI